MGWPETADAIGAAGGARGPLTAADVEEAAGGAGCSLTAAADVIGAAAAA